VKRQGGHVGQALDQFALGRTTVGFLGDLEPWWTDRLGNYADEREVNVSVVRVRQVEGSAFGPSTALVTVEPLDAGIDVGPELRAQRAGEPSSITGVMSFDDLPVGAFA